MKSLLLCTLLLATACTTQQKPPSAPDTRKPGAPTRLEVLELSASSARLAVSFDTAGENVSITLAGLDGVSLTSPPEAFSGPVKAGGKVPLAPAFTPGRGHLVITVTGTFHGMPSSRVHTVAVGEGPLKDDGALIQVTDDGDRVKVMP